MEKIPASTNSAPPLYITLNQNSGKLTLSIDKISRR